MFAQVHTPSRITALFGTVVLLATLSFGCSSNPASRDGRTFHTVPEPVSTTSSTPHEALLDPELMPDGWTEGSALDSDGGPDRLCGIPAELLDDSVNGAATKYVYGDGLPIVLQNIVETTGTDDAVESFAEVERRLADCDEADAGGLIFDVAQVAVDDLADDQTRVQLTSQRVELPFIMYLTVLRDDDLLMFFTYGDLNAETDDTHDTLLSNAVTRLHEYGVTP